MTRSFMSSPTRHPSREELQSLLTGVLADQAHTAHLEHVESCTGCAGVLASMLETSAAAGGPGVDGVPPLREDSLARILQGRSRGERRMLSGSASPSTTQAARRSAWIAAAALVAISVGALIIPSQDLTARDVAGELRLTPVLPKPGQVMQVEYRGGRFEGESRLRLRGTFRKAGEAEPEWAGTHLVVTQLTRSGSGVYRGTFVFPADAVYGAFVVEDRDGARVDSHGGKLWDVMVQDSGGRPAFAAMRQRMRYLGERDREVPRAVSRELVAVHPEQVEGWQVRQFYELQYGGRAARDSIRPGYAAHFAGSHARLSTAADVPPATMETMWLYASQLGDTAASRYWSRRVAREHPDSPEGTRQLMFEMREGHRSDRDFDAAAERLWMATAEGAREPIAFTAFMSARSSHDAAAVTRWGARLERMGSPWYNRSFVGFTLANTPGAEAAGAMRLRQHLAELGRTTDAHRLLGRSTAQQDVHTAELRAGTLAALGKALAATGDTDAALDTLQLAASTWWSSSVHAQLAALRLARGDSLAAARATAFSVVEAPAKTATAARQRFDGVVSDSSWAAWLVEGRATLKRQLLESSVVRPVLATVRVTDSRGRERRLQDLTRGQVSAVVFFSRHCLGSQEQMADLRRSAEQLGRTGVRVVAITREAASPALSEWLKTHGRGLDVYHDTHGEAAMVLEPHGTPDHLVLDSQGRIRFDGLNASELPSRVEALR